MGDQDGEDENDNEELSDARQEHLRVNAFSEMSKTIQEHNRVMGLEEKRLKEVELQKYLSEVNVRDESPGL